MTEIGKKYRKAVEAGDFRLRSLMGRAEAKARRNDIVRDLKERLDRESAAALTAAWVDWQRRRDESK